MKDNKKLSDRESKSIPSINTSVSNIYLFKNITIIKR